MNWAFNAFVAPPGKDTSARPGSLLDHPHRGRHEEIADRSNMYCRGNGRSVPHPYCTTSTVLIDGVSYTKGPLLLIFPGHFLRCPDSNYSKVESNFLKDYRSSSRMRTFTSLTGFLHFLPAQLFLKFRK